MAMNLLTLMDRYSNDTECRDLLERLRWPNGVACPRCGAADVWALKERPVYRCSGCGYDFSVTSGTIMHDSHLPLRKWFVAIYLMCESKKGVSALQLHRTLGVARRTAWYLAHRIREAMANDPLEGPTLFGVVEVDETLVGGKAKKARPRSPIRHGSPARSSVTGRYASSASRTSASTRSMALFGAPSPTKPRRSTPTSSSPTSASRTRTRGTRQ